MRLVTLISKVDAYKPNSFSNEQKTDWVNEVEGKVYTDVLLMSHLDFIPLRYREDYEYTAPEEGLSVGSYHFKISGYQNGLPNNASYTFTLSDDLPAGAVLVWDGNTLTTDIGVIPVSSGNAGEELVFTDMSDELIVDPPHDKLYAYYLEAMIDFHNGEADRYANTMQLFNDAWDDFVGYICYTYAPATRLRTPRRD